MTQTPYPAKTSTTRALAAILVAGTVALGATGCVVEPGTYVIEEDDYPTARYYDYVVYYNDTGRPFYYLDGAVVFVPETYPGYEALVINYQRHRGHGKHQGYPGNRPPPDRFDPPRRPPPPNYVNDVSRNSQPPPHQYRDNRPPSQTSERFQPPRTSWTDSAQPAPHSAPTRPRSPDRDTPSYDTPVSRDQRPPSQPDWSGRGSSSFERTASPTPRQYRADDSPGRESPNLSSPEPERASRWDGSGRSTQRGYTPSDRDDQGVRPMDGQRFRDQ